jgi:hypothetical protein
MVEPAEEKVAFYAHKAADAARRVRMVESLGFCVSDSAKAGRGCQGVAGGTVDGAGPVVGIGSAGATVGEFCLAAARACRRASSASS